MNAGWEICGLLGLDLRVFDEWLDGLDDCLAKRELSDRRRRLDEWLEKQTQFKLNLEDDDSCAVLKRHVEFIKTRWSEIAHDNAKTPYTKMGLKLSRDNSDRGKQGAQARWAGVQTLSGIYEALAKQEDTLGDPIPSNDLWLEFQGILDCAGLHPEEVEHDTDMQKDAIRWDGGKVTRGTFKNKISALRN